METQADRAAPTAARPMAVTLAKVLRTGTDVTPTLLRLVLAGVLFPHGAQHLMGWFGGYGFAGTYEWMTGLGFPGALAATAIVTEFVAPLALVVGIGSRAAAAGVVGLMVGAASVHLENGFFMNWFGKLPGGVEGYEYHILLATLATVVVIAGAGRWSADRVIARRLDASATACPVRRS